jgi:hypothetical protein
VDDGLVGLLGVVRLAGGRRWLRGPDFGLRLRVVVVVVVAADRAFELADSAADRPSELGQPFRPEYDEGDDQDDRQLKWSDIRHCNQW